MKKGKKIEILKKIQKNGLLKKRDFNKLTKIAIEQNEEEIKKIKKNTKNLYNNNKHEITFNELLKKIEFNVKQV